MIAAHITEEMDGPAFVPLPVRPGIELPVALFAGGESGILVVAGMGFF